MALTLLNTILLAGFVIGPSVGPMLKTQWQAFQTRQENRRAAAQRQAEYEAAKRFTLPVEGIVYEEDAEDAAKLLAQPHSPYRIIRDTRGPYFPPHPWTPPVRLVPTSVPPIGAGNAALLFLHARKNPGGHEQLVRVQLQGTHEFESVPYDARPEPIRRDWQISKRRRLIAQVVSDEGIAQGSRSLILWGNRLPERVIWTRGADDWEHGQITSEKRDVYRFYAGQPDPADPTHFTIDYELDGERSTIDGWLRENSGVELAPRKGAIVDRDLGRFEVTWDPKLRPTTNAATAPIFQR
jgi:hypothetical protein